MPEHYPFSFPYGNRYLCDVSPDVLALGDEDLLRKYDAEQKDGFFAYVDYRNFPDIFHTWRRTPFHGTDAPLYVQCLLAAPDVYEHGNPPHEKIVAARLERDIDSFPLDRFYERLLHLRGVRFRYDRRGVMDGIASGRGGKIKIGKNIAERNEFLWCVNLMLHELYHFVEFGMNGGFSVDGSWRFEEKETVSGHVYSIGWGDDIPVVHEFAEFLSALTMIKHPEINDRLMPHYLFLRDSAEKQRCMFRSDGEW